MIRILKKLGPVIFAALTLACYAPPEHVEPVNRNTAPQPAVNGTAPAQTAASQPPTTPVAAQPAPPSSLPPIPLTTASPDAKPKPAAQPAPAGPAPKLVVPEMKINFGTHPKDKTLTRVITIKNGGNAELKIDAVEPS